LHYDIKRISFFLFSNAPCDYLSACRG